jgi:hypothetical protein
MDIIAKISPPFQLAGILHCPDNSAKINRRENQAFFGFIFLGFMLNHRKGEVLWFETMAIFSEKESQHLRRI